MTKRLLSGLLSMTMVFSMLPNVFAQAESTDVENVQGEETVLINEQSEASSTQETYAAIEDDYTYTVSNGETTIISYTGEDSAVSIPATLGGYPVTVLQGEYYEDDWGDECYNSVFGSGIVSVTIPDSVTTIGDSAFMDCYNLTSVTMPDSVTIIGNSAFAYCEGLTSVNIPDSVTYIGEYAFGYCLNLTEIVVDAGNTMYSSDMSGALYNKDKTELLLVPCGYLGDFRIPASVTKISASAFERYIGCIWVDENNQTYSSDDRGVLFDKAKTELIQAPRTLAGSYTIPDSVITVGDGAFKECNQLTSVTLGNKVTTIGSNAFLLCTGAIQCIYIPKSVTAIGNGAFEMCFLNYVYYGGTEEQWKEIDIGECNDWLDDPIFYNCDGIFDFYEYEVTDGNAIITDYIGAGNDLMIPTTIDEHTITAIDEYAFSFCRGLKSVKIPGSILSIGEHAFEFCYELKTVVLENGVKAIANGAFEGCWELTNITIPVGVMTIGDGAFNDCTNLTIYGINGSYAQQYAEANGIPFVVLGSHQASISEEKFATLQAALDAYETGTIQLLADADSVTVTKNAVVDLNGFCIETVTATSAALTVLDSKTDDYSVADSDYGKIVSINGSVTPADGYIAIAEADGTSYHKVSLKITDMTLRSANAGVYYKCAFNGDEMVAAQVTSYGVTLSLRDAPEIGAAGSAYSVFTEFSTGTNTPSTLLKNVMKTTNTGAQNNRNANMQVYGRAYIQIGDSYIYGETVSRSFRQQVELADEIWSTLTAEQQTAVQAMYLAFRENMVSWTIPNIKNSI